MSSWDNGESAASRPTKFSSAQVVENMADVPSKAGARNISQSPSPLKPLTVISCFSTS